jgi:small subunit ribosomal protein S17
MSAKAQMVGVVVSDKMNQSVVVAVERQVRHGVYGKIQRRTSKFLAHNEGNAAKVGDQVEIFGTRPMSRRKRWVVNRIVRRAVVLAAERAPDAGDAGGER